LKNSLSSQAGAGSIETFVADFSRLSEVESLAKAVSESRNRLDVLINNAGVYSALNTITSDGLELRFAVNTIAPFLLTKRLLPLLGDGGRVVNLSSAAQAAVDLDALAGNRRLPDGEGYAQSKLALTMCSSVLGLSLAGRGPIVFAVNPGSMLASKMVKEAFGVDGADLSIGAHILKRAALSDEFADAFGRYYDNDSHRFAAPHHDALDEHKCAEVVAAIEAILQRPQRN